MDTTVTFLVTTARSGTQWLASTLRSAYPDLLVSRHEPLGYAYRPRDNLRDIDRLRLLRQAPRVAEHFAQIHRTLESRSYIETGFPAYALAPLLREEFGERLRLLQLTRHPVRVAASLVTHGWYKPGRRDDVASAVAPVPSDPGVSLPAYAERWAGMSPFERALYYWHEVHRFGLEQERVSPADGFLRVKFETLVDAPEARLALLRLLGLPEREAWQEPGQRHVDRFQKTTGATIDPAAIARHPEIVWLAGRLDYALEAVDAATLAQRYRRPWGRRLRDRLARALPALAGRSRPASAEG